MKITIAKHTEQNLYAAPIDHPITCSNPAPWLIQEVKIELQPPKVWIRNENSMWFRADQCSIGDRKELNDILVVKEIKNKLKPFPN